MSKYQSSFVPKSADLGRIERVHVVCGYTHVVLVYYSSTYSVQILIKSSPIKEWGGNKKYELKKQFYVLHFNRGIVSTVATVCGILYIYYYYLSCFYCPPLPSYGAPYHTHIHTVHIYT